ncbi:hypothetical protein BKA70DRAFT_1433583 [Coprinopsis sp. MPI-PUGE-AT-0042]|nr:hypothetical protein BKA70DRAFT_1433583 [Coprinopsis sp. MPI-PUGE-AT-0042]
MLVLSIHSLYNQMQRVNGHKPNPSAPMEMVQPLIEFYWSIRLPDTEALKRLKSSGAFDTDLYGIEIRTYRKYRESLGFTTARKQRHTPETIREDMLDLRDKYPRAGERDMAAHLFHEKDKAVAGRTLRGYFHVYEAHLVAGRRARRLLRKRFWAAGVNDVLAVDQHDKWQRFGLRLHIGVDPFPGRIQWLKIWHTNSNPKLILSYYLEFVREQHGVPLVTQSDPGPENFLLANGHTMIRWSMDLELRFWRYIQHRWKREKKNIPPEIAWSGLRARFAPGFEDLLQLGVDQEWYDYDNLVHRYVFRWIFIPWLQAELDNYRFKVNHTRRRHDPRQIVPHGRAEDIYRFPEAYGARDFKVAVPEHVIREVEEQLIPPNLPLFQLVPPEFDQCLRYSGVQKECTRLVRNVEPPTAGGARAKNYQKYFHMYASI